MPRLLLAMIIFFCLQTNAWACVECSGVDWGEVIVWVVSIGVGAIFSVVAYIIRKVMTRDDISKVMSLARTRAQELV